MAMSRRLFIFLLAAKAISAACSADRTFIILNSNDASALAFCPTYTGNIAISVNASGIIDLPKLQVLNGDLLIYNNLGLSSLRAESLSRINGKLIVRNAQDLSGLDLPKLARITDSVLDSLPKLAKPRMDIQKASNIFIGNNRVLDRMNPHVTANTKRDQNLNSSTNAKASSDMKTNIQADINTSLSTRTKVIVAVTIVVGLAIAAAIALCRFMVNRKLEQSRTKEDDEEGVITHENHQGAKNDSKITSISTTRASMETTRLQMTCLGVEEIPRPLRSARSMTLRPVKLATPIKLATPTPSATETSTPPINCAAAMHVESAHVKDGQDGKTVEKLTSRRSRNRLRQVAGRAVTAHGSLHPIEFRNPFERRNILTRFRSDDQDTIGPSPTAQVPELAKERITRSQTLNNQDTVVRLPILQAPKLAEKRIYTSQPPRPHLDLRSASLDSSCMSMSSQPPRLQLKLECSSANSSQTSLVEGTACAIAESSSIQRLKAAVVHVRTPSPRTSGGFGAHYGCDPRLSGAMAEAKKRTLSV
ncbi:hypothetical protein FKW77_001811 [Venturia effusa]|uniref:Receptor L-domain domain-containing protein n=1 Tax=Venturia effusa TaxID=50376 RepID=A0A517L6S0_9PEZI|nr:hypothetical protein FKW77_001811 [Venturia effusa]